MPYSGLGPYFGKVYTTGRQKTLRWDFLMAGAISSNYIFDEVYQSPFWNTVVFVYPDDNAHDDSYQIQTGTWSFQFPTGTMASSRFSDNPVSLAYARSTSSPNGYHYAIEVNTGFGSSQIAEGAGKRLDTWTPDPSETRQRHLVNDVFSYDIGGSGYLQIDVEECFEIIGYLQTNVGAANPPPERDGPPKRRLRIFERARIGGSVYITCASGDLSATASDVITTLNQCEIFGSRGFGQPFALPPRQLFYFPTDSLLGSEDYYNTVRLTMSCDTQHGPGYQNPKQTMDWGPFSWQFSDGLFYQFHSGVNGWPGPSEIDISTSGIKINSSSYAHIDFAQAPTRGCLVDFRARSMEDPLNADPNAAPLIVVYNSGWTEGGFENPRLYRSQNVSNEFLLTDNQRFFSITWDSYEAGNKYSANGLVTWLQGQRANAPANSEIATTGTYGLASGSLVYNEFLDANYTASITSEGGGTTETWSNFDVNAEVRPRRCLIAGSSGNLATIEHLLSLPSIDGVWSATHATLFADPAGQGVSVDVGTIPGTATKVLNEAQEWQAYRHVSFFIASKNKGMQPVVISVNGKNYSVSTGDAGVLAEVIVDIQAPQNQTARVDATDSKFPLAMLPAGVSSSLQNSIDGPYFGVTLVTQIGFLGLAPGEEYVFGDVVPKRQSSATLGMVIPDGTVTLKQWQPPVGWPVSPSYPFSNPYPHTDGSGLLLPIARAWVDGTRKALEEPFGYQPTELFAGDQSLHYYSLSELVTLINNRPGWSCVLNFTAPPDGYHVSSLPALLAMGGQGSFYNPVTLLWEDAWEIDVTEPYQLKWQEQWDYVSWYPGCGSFWQGGDYDDNLIHFECTKVIHAGVRGLVLDNLYMPYDGEDIQTEEHTLIPPGPSGYGPVVTGTSDSSGSYKTSSPQSRVDIVALSPFPQSIQLPRQHQIRMVEDTDTMDAAAFAMGGRAWYTIHFRAPSVKQSECARIAVIPMGEIGKGKRIWSEAGVINEVVGYSALGPATRREDPAAVIASGTAPAAFRDAVGIEHLYYIRAGNLYYRYNTGRAWSGESLVVTADCPEIVYVRELHRGMLLYVTGTSPNFRLKVSPLYQKSVADHTLFVDTSREVDLGTCDKACPAVEVYLTGVVQVWYKQGGSIVSKWTRDVTGQTEWTNA